MDKKIIKGENHWLEQIGGEWFICVDKKVHGVKMTVKISVKETNQKIEAVKH